MDLYFASPYLDRKEDLESTNQENRGYTTFIGTSIFSENMKEHSREENLGFTGSYNVFIKFPILLHGKKGNVQETINQQIKKEVIHYSEDFRNFMFQFRSSPPASFDLGYSILLLNENILSVRYYGYEYTGGAHGNHLIFVQNYDLNSGNSIELEDIFKENSDYKSFLIEQSKKGLNEQIRKKSENQEEPRNSTQDSLAEDIETWVESASGKNFKNFNLTSDALVLNFTDEDGMAHLWGGKLSIKIPYSRLQNYLKPDAIINKVNPYHQN